MQQFLRHKQIWDEKLPPCENPEIQAKNRIFLFATSNYQSYTKFTSRYIFVDDKYDEIS